MWATPLVARGTPRNAPLLSLPMSPEECEHARAGLLGLRSQGGTEEARSFLRAVCKQGGASVLSASPEWLGSALYSCRKMGDSLETRGLLGLVAKGLRNGASKGMDDWSSSRALCGLQWHSGSAQHTAVLTSLVPYLHGTTPVGPNTLRRFTAALRGLERTPDSPIARAVTSVLTRWIAATHPRDFTPRYMGQSLYALQALGGGDRREGTAAGGVGVAEEEQGASPGVGLGAGDEHCAVRTT
eukprot:Hpha_TRINITY_DN8556_c0_g1::TRINITY_DN8556_c0_g1_i1::g.146433::m.146433